MVVGKKRFKNCGREGYGAETGLFWVKSQSRQSAKGRGLWRDRTLRRLLGIEDRAAVRNAEGQVPSTVSGWLVSGSCGTCLGTQNLDPHLVSPNLMWGPAPGVPRWTHQYLPECLPHCTLAIAGACPVSCNNIEPLLLLTATHSTCTIVFAPVLLLPLVGHTAAETAAAAAAVVTANHDTANKIRTTMLYVAIYTIYLGDTC